MKLKNYKERMSAIPEETRESVREGNRIDEILYDTIPFFKENENMNPHYANLIRKSMQQYGAERYQGGRIDQEKVENFKLGLQSDELIRLRELVQAQKELIDLHDKLAESDFLTKKEWMRIDVLRNKIKELDQ